jgi:cation-transporting P-type ATPase 13A2
VKDQTYGHPFSTVFGLYGKDSYQDFNVEDDFTLKRLRSIDYRYIRFLYHPFRDKFIVANSWKDPSWTGVKFIRSGLNTQQRDARERVVGRNLIDIEEKSVGQLLVDEVYAMYRHAFHDTKIFIGLSPILCISNC